MKTAKLIEQLQKIESQDPGGEIDFKLQSMGVDSPEVGIGFMGVRKDRDDHGQVWILEFLTDYPVGK